MFICGLIGLHLIACWQSTVLAGSLGINKKCVLHYESIMQFVGYMAGQYAERGESALSLEQPFDEFKLLTEHLEFVKRGTETELGTFEILDAASEEAAALLANARGQQEPSPGKPQPLFYNLPAAE